MVKQIKKYKELIRGKFKTPMYLDNGDTFELLYTPGPKDGPREIAALKAQFGEPDALGQYLLLSHGIIEPMAVDEAVMFSGKFEDRKALGCVVLEVKPT